MIRFKIRTAYLKFLIWVGVAFSRMTRQELRQELFLVRILFTNVYLKQSLQDKITSVSRLIEIFVNDHGFIPKQVLSVLYIMNIALNREVVLDFEKSYQRDMDDFREIDAV